MTPFAQPSPPDYSDSLAAMLANEGFVFLNRWLADEHSEDIVSRVGRVLRLGRGDAVHRVVPHAAATPNTYSGIYGLGGFPLHTDMAHWRIPPRYLMLRCLRGHASVKTLVIDGFRIVTSVGEDRLTRALVKPRRPTRGELSLLQIYRPRRADQPSLLRWDEKFIVPASAAGLAGISLVRDALSVMNWTAVSLCEPGDTLFIDNWRMLHGRSAVASDHADRIIERAYLGEIY